MWDFRWRTRQGFTRGQTTESFDLDALGIGPIRAVADNNRVLSTEEHGLPFFAGLLPQEVSWIDEPDSLQVGDHVSMVRGNHNLKAGYELYQLSVGRTASNTPNGRFAFSNFQTGSNIASLLMGFPNSTVTPQGWRPQTAQAGRQGGYFHDDWKAGRRLTLNFGLRFDYNGNPREINGEWRTLNFPGGGRGLDSFTDPETGQLIPTFGPAFLDERAAVKLWKQDVRFFMPRLGIAYRPADKWVIRTGAGWFDNLMHQNSFTILNLNPPKSVSFQFNSVVNNAQTIPVVGADGVSYDATTRAFRDGLPVVTMDDPFFVNTPGNAIQGAINVLYIPPDYKDGDVWKWSFDVQRDLPFRTLFTVGYVGSKSTHIANSLRNWNSPLPSPDRNVQANRPYQRVFDPATPEFGIRPLAVIRYLDSYDNSFHHGLQAKLDKRFSHGLTFGLAYTYSKTHGDGEAGGNQGAQMQNPRVDRRADRGRLRFDQRHIFVGHFVCEMPGRGSARPAPTHHRGLAKQRDRIASHRFSIPSYPEHERLERPGFGNPSRSRRKSPPGQSNPKAFGSTHRRFSA